MDEPSYITGKTGLKLAYIHTSARPEGKEYPLVMFLGGFMSDMCGTKATWLEQQCRERGQAFLRLDYSGHGQSEGEFKDGTISRWKEDALSVFDHVVKEPAILIGSSMGGWIGLHLALERKEAVRGFIGIAAAPDFTEGMYNDYLTEAQKKEIEEKGYTELPNEHGDDPYIITRALIEDGKKNCLLGKKRQIDVPVCLIQGREDKEVPWETALEIEKTFEGDDLDIIFIEEGGHSLSRPEDLTLIDKKILDMSRAWVRNTTCKLA